MTAGEWWVTAFALGAGASILAYWALALVFDLLPRPALDGGGAEVHVVAETVTASLLIGAGLARLMTEAAWVNPLTGVALGALTYALIRSPSLYPDIDVMPIVFGVAAVATVSAIIVLLAGT